MKIDEGFQERLCAHVTENSINTTVGGGAVGVAGALVVRIENQYVGVPAPSAMSSTELGIARIFQARIRAFTDEYLVSQTGPVPFGGATKSWITSTSGYPIRKPARGC